MNGAEDNPQTPAIRGAIESFHRQISYWSSPGSAVLEKKPVTRLPHKVGMGEGYSYQKRTCERVLDPIALHQDSAHVEVSSQGNDK